MLAWVRLPVGLKLTSRGVSHTCNSFLYEDTRFHGFVRNGPSLVVLKWL